MAITLTYITTLTSDANNTTFNFGDATIPGDGCVVVGISGRSGSNRVVSSVDVGGSAADVRVATASSTNACAIATRAVTAGDRAISVTFNGSMVRAAVSVWLMTGHASEVPIDTDSAIGTSTSSSLTMDFPSSGRAVYVIHTQGATDITWGTATQRYDELIEATSRHSVADKVASGAGNSETINFASGTFGCVSAVWEPASGGGGNPWYYNAQQSLGVAA